MTDAAAIVIHAIIRRVPRLRPHKGLKQARNKLPSIDCRRQLSATSSSVNSTKAFGTGDLASNIPAWRMVSKNLNYQRDGQSRQSVCVCSTPPPPSNSKITARLQQNQSKILARPSHNHSKTTTKSEHEDHSKHREHHSQVRVQCRRSERQNYSKITATSERKIAEETRALKSQQSHPKSKKHRLTKVFTHKCCGLSSPYRTT